MADNITKFLDVPTSADPIHPYNASYAKTPIVIDNGCFKCRAGWATQKRPKLIFKNVVAKSRSKKEKEVDLQVGNDIANIEVVRGQLRSPFDRNVMVHLESQEQLLDYTFNHLGIDADGRVPHGIVMTEAMANPNMSRSMMSELLFECYGVPEITYGVDSLFSLYQNHVKPMDALVISCGYSTTHVIPVLGGLPQAAQCRRINLGGLHADLYMQRLLQLKHPPHYAAVTVSRSEELVQRFCHLAPDFQSTLKLWAADDFYAKHVRKIQLPFTQLPGGMLTAEQQRVKREQQIQRLREVNARRREQKLAEDQEKLQELIQLQIIQDDEDNEEFFVKQMKKFDIDSLEELQAIINQLNNSIHHTMHRIRQDQLRRDGGGGAEKEAKRMPKAKDNPQKKMKTDKSGELSRSMPLNTEDKEAMEAWLEGLRQQRQRLLDRRAARRQRRSDMTKRRTAASHQRMKILTALAQGTKKNKVDTFGKNDEDWDVYKEINKDAGDSDSEAEQEKLDELETMLREYDEEFKDPNEQNVVFDVADYYRLHVSTEQIRVPEILFQPSMIGMDQAGIAETMDFVLKKFTPEQQKAMTQCVFLTGGCASFPNFKERLNKELQEMLPFQSTFKVYVAADPVLNAWQGACKWATSPNYSKFCVTRAEYDEYGAEYLKMCTISNKYLPTPPSAKAASSHKKDKDESMDVQDESNQG